MTCAVLEKTLRFESLSDPGQLEKGLADVHVTLNSFLVVPPHWGSFWTSQLISPVTRFTEWT